MNDTKHHHTETSPRPTVSQAVIDRVENYSPTLLTASQSTLMLADIRDLALRTEPTSAVTAGHLLAAICKFVRDTAPASGCALSDVLTPAQVTAWIAAQKQRKGKGRSLSQDHVLLRRALRVQQQLPARVASARPRRLAPAPLRASDVAQLAAVCRAAGRSAARGFVAAFGVGLCGRASDGSRFERVGDELALVTPDGKTLAVASELQWSELDGVTVRDGDWDEVCHHASMCRIHLQAVTVTQSYRELALLERRPLRVAVARYRLTEGALNDIAPYLPSVDLDTDDEAAAMLQHGRSVAL